MSSSRKVLVLDPMGDVFIVLGKPVDQSDLQNTPNERRTSVDDAAAGEVPADDVPADDVPTDDAPIDDVPVDGAAALDEASETVTDHISARISIDEIELQVSSRHLSLSSKVFSNMFLGRSLDHDPSTDRASSTIPLPGDNLHAMDLLLKIVHGLNRMVPRNVDLDTLLQVAILVDKYEFHEAAEVFTDMWFDHLRLKISKHHDRDLGAWIFICSVLGKSMEYTSLTKIAILETKYGLMDSDDLEPIPDWIKGQIANVKCVTLLTSSVKIQSRRLNVFDECIRMLSGLLESYSISEPQCHYNTDCDALSLGKLIRGLNSAGLHPVPEPLSLTRSVDDLFKAVRGIDLSPLCAKYDRKSHGYQYGFERHIDAHVDKKLKESLSKLEDKIQGLKLTTKAETELQSYSN